MTDISPAEAIEEILGVPIEDDRPPAANPCWEEKHGRAVSSYDPDTFEVMTPFEAYLIGRLTSIEQSVAMTQTAVNQIGAQTNWLVNAFAEARAGFMAMSTQLAEAGPLGLIKMMSGKNKKTEKTDG